MDHKFQIHLRGIIALLSEHLYSGPQVCMRELLQNATDAIRARVLAQKDTFFGGTVELELIRGTSHLPTIVVQDDGIGLTEAQAHQFLATIGESSKRGDISAARNEFIGQFGIGLLSCFMIADEIVVISRSIEPGSAAIEWRGRPDGTYEVRALEGASIEPGTKVYLRARADSVEWFKPEKVEELCRHYGALLPFPIRMRVDGAVTVLNDEPPPWRQRFASEADRRAALMEFGRRVFGLRFLDCIPLRSSVGDVEGVAFVLPHATSPAARGQHRVYLKGMLLTEKGDELLPDWAVFVRCVITANDLRPVASREAFFEDARLAATRDTLGNALRSWLIRIAEQEPARFQRILDLHHVATRLLAARDAECFKVFADLLPFETTLGRMTLGRIRSSGETLRYARTVDEFRQLAPVATSERILVVNAGYWCDEELLLQLQMVYPDTSIEAIDAGALSSALGVLTPAEEDALAPFVAAATSALERFDVTVSVRRFSPHHLAALYTADPRAGFSRQARKAQESSDALFSGLLDSLMSDASNGGAVDAESQGARICLNLHNPLVARLARLENPQVVGRAVELLYVQSLLQGHHPLSGEESSLLSEGIATFVGWTLEGGSAT